MATQSIVLPGCVHSLGEAESAGRLYADLTGRPHVSCTSIEYALSSHDVVVCLAAELTPNLMNFLYAKSTSIGAPGLICAATTSELETVCRHQVARLARKRRETPKRIFLFPNQDFRQIRNGTDTFVSGSLSTGELLGLVSSDADILFIYTRGDGVDFALSSRHFVCPFLPGAPQPNSLVPACQYLGRCTRFPARPPISAARDAGWLVPLSALRAEIAIIEACRIAKLRDGIVGTDYGLMATLPLQADFGVLLTTWREGFGLIPDQSTFQSLFRDFIEDLSAGAMAGAAVHRFNRSDVVAMFGLNLCVIGDPCFRLVANGSFTALPKSAQGSESAALRSPAPRPGMQSDNPEAALLHDAVVQTMRYDPHCDPLKGEVLARRLAACKQAAPAPSTVSDPNSLDLAFLEFLETASFFDSFRKTSVSESGLSFTVEDVAENAVCPSCHSIAQSFSMRFPNYGARAWRIFQCACCDKAVIPDDWHLSLDLARIEDGILALSGLPSDAEILLSLRGEYPLQDMLHHRRHVKTSSEERPAVFELPTGLPLIPLRCRLLIARQLEFACIQFGLRLLQDGKLSTARLALAG